MYNFVFLCIFLRGSVWVYFGIYLGGGGLWLVVLLTLVFFYVLPAILFLLASFGYCLLFCSPLQYFFFLLLFSVIEKGVADFFCSGIE